MYKTEINKNKVISSFVWKFLERIGVQGLQFIISIVLARLLTPSDYGVVALISIFIQLARVFIESGFGNALIQKKDADDLDFSSVFYLSLFIAIVMYLILFFTAPLIARFYDQKILIPILRVLSLTLIFGSINGLQGTVVSKTLDFKRFFFSSIIGIAISGVIGLLLAYKNYGPWALVWQQLSMNIAVTIILWFTVKWRPKLLFSFARLKTLFSFGWKLLVSSLLDTIFRNIHGLVIGKIYSKEMLGIYTRGKQFPEIISTNIDGSIQSVLFPAYSAKNDDINALKNMVRRSITTSSFFMIPAMLGLATIAKPLVMVLLTEKWLDSVPFIQIACIYYSWRTIHTSNLTAINALGRSDIFLKLEIIKKTNTLIALLITIPMGIMPMIIGQAITSALASFINAYPNKKLLQYSYFEQIKDILPYYIISIIMVVPILFFQLVNIPLLLSLTIQILLGIIIYTGISYIFKIDAFLYVKKTISDFFIERKPKIQ
jgi:O-antigen/teichoic acid export membrane protein